MSEPPSEGRSPEDLFAAAQALFEELCDLPPADRAARLAAADAELRATVEELLEIDSRTGSGLDQPPLGDLTRQPADLPETVAGFRVLELLGAGGAGVVYKARQEHPDRLVAVKVIRSAAVSDEQLRRFEHEAQVLAWLDHPGIARIFAAGTTETGHAREPYFAMELIEGLPLTRHADEHGLGTRARLELLARVCDAVHHAHQKGVIHRDLKPSNVLVDARGEPKVLDFGVARVTSSDLELSTLHTHTGEILGTLPYMSPEQLSGDPAALDIRCDVYSLGVLGYQLLSGSLPHDLVGARLAEAARRITDDEPSSLGVLDRSLRGDVETIVGKAIAKEKERRYASAEELAVDIRRHLADEPIAARPPTTLYQLERFARRNRVLVGGVIAVFVALAVGTVVSTALYFDKEEERLAAVDARTDAEKAEAEERAARETAEAAREAAEVAGERERTARREAEDEADLRVAMFDQLATMLSSPTPWTDGTEIKMVDVLDAAALKSKDSFTDRPLVRAELLQTFGVTYTRLELFDRALPFAEESYKLLLEHDSDSVRRTVAQDLHGQLLFETGDLTGLQVLEEALALMEELDAPASLRSNAADRLGGMLQVVGRMEEAEAYTRLAIAICEEAPEATTRLDLASANQTLGDFQMRTGRFREAIGTLEVAVELMRSDAPETMDLATTLTSLAVSHAQLREMETALPILEEAIQIERDLGATEQLAFAVSLGNSATFHAMDGDYMGAMERYEEALALTRRIDEGDGANVDEAILLGNLAKTYRTLGRLDEALEYSQEGARLLAEVYGERNLRHMNVVAITAETLIDLGRYEEGLVLMEEVIEFAEQALPPGHPDRANHFMWLGRALLALDRPGEAVAIHRRALELQSGSQRGDATMEVVTEASVAAGLALEGDVEEALASAERAMARALRNRDEGHWATLFAQGVLGLCRFAAEQPEGWGEFERAVESLRASQDTASRACNADRLERLGTSFQSHFGS